MTITLPEAIRKGSTYQPQGSGDYIVPSKDEGALPSTCVMGAALAGIVGHPLSIGDQDDYTRDFLLKETSCDVWHHVAREDLPPVLQAKTVSRYRNLDDILINLNDEHFWTREAIADWLEDYLQRKGLL